MQKLLTTLAVLIAIIGGWNSASAQNNCPNSGFALGNFTDWTGKVNNIAGILPGTPNSLPSTPGSQTIMNLPGTDPNTANMLSILPPAGTSVCRLGNSLCKACDSTAPTSASLSYAITVTASNCIFTYEYAVVLQDSFGSVTANAARFNIEVLNNAGQQIGGVCGVYNVVAQNNLPGFTKCLPASIACAPQDTVLWKDWTTASIDLSPYIGQNVSIQFTVIDASNRKDFSYAYISCSCGTPYCKQLCTGDSDIIVAPAGFAAYHWNPGGDSTQSITVNNPVNGTVYSCILTSVTGCIFMVYDTISCTTSIEAITGRDDIIISPNPAINDLYIETSKPAIIDITSIQGQLIKTLAISNNKIKIDVSTFPCGLYIVEVRTERGTEVRKFIKE
jgi:hypothetical protein